MLSCGVFKRSFRLCFTQFTEQTQSITFRNIFSFTFFFCRKKKVTKKSHHKNQPQVFVLPTKTLRHISTKLVVRTFCGRQPHSTKITFCAMFDSERAREV